MNPKRFFAKLAEAAKRSNQTEEDKDSNEKTTLPFTTFKSMNDLCPVKSSPRSKPSKANKYKIAVNPIHSKSPTKSLNESCPVENQKSVNESDNETNHFYKTSIEMTSNSIEKSKPFSDSPLKRSRTSESSIPPCSINPPINRSETIQVEMNLNIDSVNDSCLTIQPISNAVISTTPIPLNSIDQNIHSQTQYATESTMIQTKKVKSISKTLITKESDEVSNSGSITKPAWTHQSNHTPLSSNPTLTVNVQSSKLPSLEALLNKSFFDVQKQSIQKSNYITKTKEDYPELPSMTHIKRIPYKPKITPIPPFIDLEFINFLEQITVGDSEQSKLIEEMKEATNGDFETREILQSLIETFKKQLDLFEYQRGLIERIREKIDMD